MSSEWLDSICSFSTHEFRQCWTYRRYRNSCRAIATLSMQSSTLSMLPLNAQELRGPWWDSKNIQVSGDNVVATVQWTLSCSSRISTTNRYIDFISTQCCSTWVTLIYNDSETVFLEKKHYQTNRFRTILLFSWSILIEFWRYRRANDTQAIRIVDWLPIFT